MKPDKLPPPRMIESLPELEELAERLKPERRVAVDIESDGFYVYHEKVCLLQLSTANEDFVIDPLAVQDLSPLGPVFRDPAVEKLFHAGEYDIVCLKRDYGFRVLNVFDTMIAARTLGAARLGLAPTIEKYFEIKLSKKLQRANWGKRPLTAEQIQYARLDTHYLIPLRDILNTRLVEKRLLRDAQDDFRRLELVEPTPRVFDPEAFWHLKGARGLSPQKRAVLKRLYLYREKKASSIDRAPFRVLPEDLLVRLAGECPRSPDGLRKIRGLTPYLLKHYGRDIARVIEEGLKAAPIDKPPERPQKARWDADTQRRYEALRMWRKSQAEKRSIHPIVILATEELRRLSQAPREDEDETTWLGVLSSYKRELYGEEILAILKEPKPPKRRRRRK